MKTKARAIFSKYCSRTRYYDRIALTDDGHPVDLAVQYWLRRGQQHQRRILDVQEQLLARLAPDARPFFLELEELQNACSAEREEAYFDAGVALGIDRERRRQRTEKLSPAARRLVARVRRCIDRAELEPHDATRALVEVVADSAASRVEFHANERESPRRRGARARAT